jgi:hypothetical protein
MLTCISMFISYQIACNINTIVNKWSATPKLNPKDKLQFFVLNFFFFYNIEATLSDMKQRKCSVATCVVQRLSQIVLFLFLLWDLWLPPPRPPPTASQNRGGNKSCRFPQHISYATEVQILSDCLHAREAERVSYLSERLGPPGAGARSIFPRACYRTTSSNCRCGVISSKHTLKLLPTSAVTFRWQLPAIIH